MVQNRRALRRRAAHLLARLQCITGGAGTVLNRQRLLSMMPRMRILHTMLRVGDLERSIAFYTEVIGMRLLRRRDNEKYQYTLAFVGFTDESDGAVLELTYNWHVTAYQLGDAFGHVAIEVDDVYATCATIRQRGGEVAREPGPVKGGTTEIAFVRDPDGYSIELIQKRATAAD